MSQKYITIINSPNPICGVHQMGKKLFDYFKELGQYNYHYTEDILPKRKPDAVIFNWHLATMPNLKKADVERLQSYKIKVGIIPHNKNHEDLNCFDFVLHDDCLHPDNSREIGLPRVIIPFVPKVDPIPKSVNTFGFCFTHKNWEGLAQKIDKEYWIKANTCIQLDINTDFMTNEGIVEWLSHGEISAFPYIQHPDSKGQTTVIDFALSARRPLCISDSGLFDHIRHIPKISFNDNTFQEVINDGIDKFAPLYEEWTKEKLVVKVEKFLAEKLGD